MFAATESALPLSSVVDAATLSAPLQAAWLIPVVPAVSAALLLLFGRRLGRLSAMVAILAVGFSATLSTLVFLALRALPEGQEAAIRTAATWIDTGALRVDWAFLFDPLSSVMLLLVTWVGLLIHIYSTGYMAGDPRYSRFFAYLNLFVASMLVLVLGASFLTLFVGWELVGLCSYLLIGFWFEKRDYATAAKKAFVVNRIGDVGFMVAMFVIFATFGSLDFAEVLPGAETVLGAGSATAVVIALLLFVGAAGKSAQIPLYVWLPDAMAGPTPVSALIHAATMVTAGVYLLARTSPIWALVPEVGLAVAWVGVATALVAAIIACAQRDLKKILAYSTVSQLGYMFVGVGLGDQVGGIFHLLTHGFFKALLFLAAGSVMHAMADRTDVWAMGGLWRKMPITMVTSAVAVLAISGFPGLSGFWSKEEILAAAADTPGAQGIWVIGALVAGLTAFYMTRWFVLIFLGRPRWEHVETGFEHHPDHEHEHAPTGAVTAGAVAAGASAAATPERDARAVGVGRAERADDAAIVGEPAGHDLHPHESPLSMTLPLMVLAVLSAFGGFLNINPETGWLHGWLEPSVVRYAGDEPFLAHTLSMAIVVALGLIGIAAGLLLYLRRWTGPAPATGGSGAAQRAFGVDRFYERTVLAPGRIVANAFTAFDLRGIDGAVNGLAAGTGGFASVSRRLQTGLVRSYALGVLGGAVLVVVLFAAAGVVR